MRWDGVAFRGHDPKWAWSPISGDGAAAKGGRFNPKGVPALYLALSLEGLLLEVCQGFAHRLEPLTICAYGVAASGLADLRTEEGRAAAAVKLEDMACAWAYDMACHRAPPSWVIARTLIAQGVNGVLVPSFAQGARSGMDNLVLWKWGPDSVAVFDPKHLLPRDQSSWR